MKRHFTATAFVVRDGRTLLHWHRKLGQWMPPGGHLLPDEDPVAGALREVLEETGLAAELIVTSPAHAFAYPQQLAAPYAILLEDIPDDEPPHQHIDLIYFCRPLDGEEPHDADETLTWVSAEQLEQDEALPRPNGASARVPADVRALGLAAIEAAGRRS